MADNLNTIIELVDEKITNTGGPGSIKAEDHNNIHKQIITKTGKYSGLYYVAEKNRTEFPSGSMSWNDNALNEGPGVFTITVSKNTSDFNDIGEVLKITPLNSTLQIKDFNGRSSMYTITSYQEAQINGDDVYNIILQSLDNNVNYIYQDLESLICSLNIYTNASKIYQPNELLIFRAAANSGASGSVPLPGDTVIAVSYTHLTLPTIYSV